MKNKLNLVLALDGSSSFELLDYFNKVAILKGWTDDEINSIYIQWRFAPPFQLIQILKTL